MNETDKNLLQVFWYNDEDYIPMLLEYLEKHQYESRMILFPNELCFKCDSFRSIFWQILVLKFGNYGISPRFGWIENIDECIKYVRIFNDELQRINE